MVLAPLAVALALTHICRHILPPERCHGPAGQRVAAKGAPYHSFPIGRGRFLGGCDLGKVPRQGLGKGRSLGLGSGDEYASGHLGLDDDRPRLGLGVEGSILGLMPPPDDLRLPSGPAARPWPFAECCYATPFCHTRYGRITAYSGLWLVGLLLSP